MQLFKGRSSFAEFMEGGERIATNILADRRRQVYALTRKGADLAPVLVEMILWSARYHRTDAPPAVVRRMKKNRARFIAGLRV